MASVQVCDLHERLKHLDTRDLPWGVHPSSTRSAASRGEPAQNGSAGDGDGARVQRSTSVSIAQIANSRTDGHEGGAAQGGRGKVRGIALGWRDCH